MNYRLLQSSLLLLLLPLVAFGNNISGAFCGWDPQWEDGYYPIIDQYELIDSSFYGFLNCPDDPFCDSIENATPSKNMEEWVSYYKGVFTRDELQEIIFKRPVEWFQGKEGFEKYDDYIGDKLNKSEYSFFKKYLELAKLSQNAVSNRTSGTGWYQGEEYYYSQESYSIDKRLLLSKALELVAVAPDDFMRNRAGFQAVKMAHYLQENDAAIHYFKTILKLIPEYQYIYYRAMEEMAGAAYNLNLQTTAAKAYLEVYNQLPDRRNGCAISLRYLDWELLESTREFTDDQKNADVKSFFKAFHGRGSTIREMENIALSDVNSPYLQVLAIRWLDQMQASIFEHNVSGYYNDYDDYDDYDEYDDDYDDYRRGIDLREFTQKMLANNNLKNRDLWVLIMSMTYLFDQEENSAVIVLENYEPLPSFKKHFKRLMTAVKFMGIRSIDRELINNSYKEIAMDEDLRTHKPTVAAFFNHISALYNDVNNPITSVLVSVSYDSYSNEKEFDWRQVENSHAYNWGYQSKYNYLDDNIINNFDLFISLPEPTTFESIIIKRMEVNPKDYVHDLRGTFYLKEDLLEKAIIEFSQVENTSSFWEEDMRLDIFSASIKEYMNIPFVSISDGFHKKYHHILGKDAIVDNETDEREAYNDNKLKLAQVLLKLKGLAQTDLDNAADYYYMIGNAWYNMSNQGWFMNNTYYISNNNRNELLSYDYEDDGGDQIEDNIIMHNANNYLLKGLAIQNASSETKAAILFMLAKTNSCESGSYNYDTDEYSFNICGKHREYFNQLQHEYSDTQYYQEVLRECSWFAGFVN